jgi:hypothetical protein
MERWLDFFDLNLLWNWYRCDAIITLLLHVALRKGRRSACLNWWTCSLPAAQKNRIRSELSENGQPAMRVHSIKGYLPMAPGGLRPETLYAFSNSLHLEIACFFVSKLQRPIGFEH